MRPGDLALSFAKKLTRTKYVNWATIQDTNLARCLTTLDLVALGVGSTLGAGAYVITGQVAKNYAGPAVILSFFIAAVASVLAGICYAEFGARVPKTGSAYTFTYVTVGEGLAFVIGWNLLLEYVIGAASVARTFSGYFDYLVGNKIRPWLISAMPMHADALAEYADPIAFTIIMLVTIILTIGAKESAIVNKVFTALNLLVLSYIVICGAFKDDTRNWQIPEEEAELHQTCGKNDQESCGKGGFAPYGFGGIVKGAATAFYAYVGFDAIATTGEEVKNPRKAIPISIIISLAVVFLVYTALSVTVTMMAPYYELSDSAPIAQIFENVGWTAAKYIITIGAICALSTSLLGSMFPMPRVVLAMARDGLIFRFLGRVHPRLKTPIYATVLTGFLAALMAFIFDVEALVSMMSIGTLLAYTLVGTCVLILRYEFHSEDEEHMGKPTAVATLPMPAELHPINSPRKLQKSVSFDLWQSPHGTRESIAEILKPGAHCATPFSALTVKVATALLVVQLLTLSILVSNASTSLFVANDWFSLTALALVILFIIVTVIVIMRQPQSRKKLSFTVPCVPLFPALSMLVNIYLMVQLDNMTWVRFAVWMCVGLIIYFGYGIRNSSEQLGIREDDEYLHSTDNLTKLAKNGSGTDSERPLMSVPEESVAETP